MKKRFIAAAALAALLASCPNPAGNGNNTDKPNPGTGEKTTIVFDNTHGICPATVYSDRGRTEGDKIAEIPAGGVSGEIEWLPGASMPFYFAYRITLKGISGFTLNYVPAIGKDQAAVHIDAGKKTTIPVPRLEETLSSPDELLTSSSYLFIQNSSSYPFRLHRMDTAIVPENASNTVVNAGERALYKINPGAASYYRLLVGADYKTLPASIVSFEAGYLYRFDFNGNVSLNSEIEIILANIAPSSQNTAAPPTPAAPQVNASDKMLTLRWKAVEGAENYEIYLATDSEPPAAPAKTVPGTSTVLDNLNNKTAYNVWLKALNSAGSSAYSPLARGIPWPAGEAPAAPERPRIIPGVNQVTVQWDASGGAETYEVYISTNTAQPSAAVVSGANKTEAVISNLENDVIYYVWVRAVNSAGKSGYSPLESAVPTTPTRTPASPGRPVLTEGSRQLGVSWQAVELAAAYEVWAGTSGDSALAAKQGGDISGGATETVLAGLVNETTYYVWLKAKNSVGTSGFSPPAFAKPSAFAVQPLAPAAPSVSPGSRELSLTWQEAEGALSYEVWISTTTNPAGAEKHGADVSGLSVTLKNLSNETTYYIWLKSGNSTGTSGFSPMASGTPSVFYAPPIAPAAPQLTLGNGRLTASWARAEGALSYDVFAGTSAEPQQAEKKISATTELSAVITGLSNGTAYNVWLKAKNDAGDSGFSPSASGTPAANMGPPVTPAAPVISGVSGGKLYLAWAAVEGADDYEVFCAPGSSPPANPEQTVQTTLATISGLNNGTSYNVWLKAKNAKGTSGLSPMATGKPIADSAAPTVSAGNSQLTVTWGALAGADAYDVYCGTGDNPPTTAAASVAGTSTTIGSLTNGTPYKVWVRGKNSTGSGTVGPASSGTPIGNMGTVTATAGNGQLTLTWAAVAGAEEYEVYYSTADAMPTSPVQSGVTATTATIGSLTNGTVYNVWVKPKNPSGAGGVSAMASGKPIGNMGAVTATAGNGQMTLTWVAVAGADEYEVYYSTVDAMPASPAQTGVTANTATVSSLTNGQTYYVWVKPKNANGAGGVSKAIGKPIGNMGTVTATAGNGQLTLTWAAVAGAEEYEVYYSTSATMPENPAQVVSTNTATIGSLTNGTTYYVWVKPKNANGAGGVSTVIFHLPSSPIITAAPVLPEQLVVTWNADPNAELYEVYYGTANPPQTLFTTTSGTSATITGLTNGQEYWVRLRTISSGGTSGYWPSATEIAGGSPGLYKGSVKIGSQNIASALNYIGTDANTTSGDNYYIIPGTDESIGYSVLDYSGKTVSITLLSYRTERTISHDGSAIPSDRYSGLFSVKNGVTLTLGENITFAGQSTTEWPMIFLREGGMLIMNADSKIRDNKGSGVYIYDTGSFIMNGGTISGNTNDGQGGGVKFLTYSTTASGGSFTMNGGTISGNKSNYGGGVFIYGGSFFMNGGTISGNESSAQHGGGVYIYGGSFTMNGGTISGNKSNDEGGGVYFQNGSFVMNSGTISGNEARYLGGGISIESSGSFTMNGGTISGNEVNSQSVLGWGGGIYSTNGSFTMNGGIISRNKANGNSWGSDAGQGGGVYISNGGFTMTGGTISGNEANNQGGGSGGGQGGGVFVADRGTFKKSLPDAGGQNSGIIYGSETTGNDEEGRPLKNTANSSLGDTVYYNTSLLKRNTTAGQQDYIDTSTGQGLSADGEPPYGQ